MWITHPSSDLTLPESALLSDFVRTSKLLHVFTEVTLSAVLCPQTGVTLPTHPGWTLDLKQKHRTKGWGELIKQDQLSCKLTVQKCLKCECETESSLNVSCRVKAVKMSVKVMKTNWAVTADYLWVCLLPVSPASCPSWAVGWSFHLLLACCLSLALPLSLPFPLSSSNGI